VGTTDDLIHGPHPITHRATAESKTSTSRE
jgi:hypothetical protein